MKITAVKPYTVHPGWRKNLILVTVETDEGIHGWGEAYSQYDRDTAVTAQLVALGRYAVGRDPFASAAVLLAGTKFTREIFAQSAISQHSVVETLPGPDVRTDDQLAQYFRDFGSTIYHPVGTCRMGEGPAAVVDPRLRVHGIEGLRVADASIMPTLTTGNTNAPTIMIGEKCAAVIKEDAAA